MSAFFNDESLKDLVIENLKEHRRLDEIVQGRYFENGKGCNLGCLTHCNENSHESAERMFNIPQKVDYWLEAVFENLPSEKCADWVIESSVAIPVGADLSLAHHHLAYWLLGDESPSRDANKIDKVSEQVIHVRSLHEKVINGIDVTEAAWSAASSAAWSAAESAAESARSAAESAAWSAASSAAWESIAKKSIEIFKACPVVSCDRCEQSIAQTKFLLQRGDLVRIEELTA